MGTKGTLVLLSIRNRHGFFLNSETRINLMDVLMLQFLNSNDLQSIHVLYDYLNYLSTTNSFTALAISFCRKSM